MATPTPPAPPTTTRPLLVLLALAALGAAAPRAAVAGNRYAVRAAVRPSPSPAVKVYPYDGARLGLPIGAGSVEVQRQALSAFAVAAAGMFEQGVEGGPAVALQVDVAAAAIVPSGVAGRAQVTVEVLALGPTGQELDRWTVEGAEGIRGFDPRAVSQAFGRAAAASAAAFERAFDASARIGAWLEGAGVARRVPPAARVVSARRGTVVALDLAGGKVGDGAGLSVRAGISGELFLASLVLTRSAAPFDAAPAFGAPLGAVRFTPTSLGADVGLLRRVGPLVELRGGLGLHVVGGTARLRYALEPMNAVPRELAIERWRVGGSAFAGGLVTLGPWTRHGLRARIGVEARHAFGGSMTFEAFQATVKVPGTSFLLSAGVELPLR